MSYCRFSSDDWQCDVYVYADVAGGWTTHVARNRPVFKGPLPDPIPLESSNIREWMERDSKVMAMLDDAEHQNIGLDFDGQSFNHETAKECADNLEALREAGYNVPQYAIDSLREDDSDKKVK